MASSGLRTIGQLLGLFRDKNLLKRPSLFEGDFVQEAERSHRDAQAAWGEPLHGRQMDLIGTNLFGPKFIGRLMEKVCECRNLLEIRQLGIARKVSHAHIVEHALT